MAAPGLQTICAVLRGEQSPPSSNFLSHTGFISPGELALLTDALGGSRATIGLRLKACQLGDSGAAAIAAALSNSSSSLTSLELPCAFQNKKYGNCSDKLNCEAYNAPGRVIRRQRDQSSWRACASSAYGVKHHADVLRPERCGTARSR